MKAPHHGHHHHVDSGQGGGNGGMWQALLSSGTQGASADSSGSGSSGTPSGSGNDANYLEQLIRLQAQSLTVSTSQSLVSV